MNLKYSCLVFYIVFVYTFDRECSSHVELNSNNLISKLKLMWNALTNFKHQLFLLWVYFFTQVSFIYIVVNVAVPFSRDYQLNYPRGTSVLYIYFRSNKEGYKICLCIYALYMHTQQYLLLFITPHLVYILQI